MPWRATRELFCMQKTDDMAPRNWGGIRGHDREFGRGASNDEIDGVVGQCASNDRRTESDHQVQSCGQLEEQLHC